MPDREFLRWIHERLVIHGDDPNLDFMHKLRSIITAIPEDRVTPNTEMLINLGENELLRIRQWFDSVQDTNPKYLESKDYILARRIYEAEGMRVPNSILEKC